MASPHQYYFSLTKRRSNSSPQLHCEATDFSSVAGASGNTNVSRSTTNSATSSWSETIDAAPRKEASKNFRGDNVTQASVHWLEPKQRAVLHDEPVIVKPKAKSALQMQCRKTEALNKDTTSQLGPDSDLLRCNETIHYLQGSDSDSETCRPNNQRRKSHACIQKQRRNSSRKFKRLSKAAGQFLSKLKLLETKQRKERETYKETIGSNDSDSDGEQPVVRRRSRSLTSRVLKRFGPKDDETSPERCASESPRAESPPITAKGKQRLAHSKPVAKAGSSSKRKSRQAPLVNFAKFDPEKYPIECTEEIERAAREREIEEGIDLPDQASSAQSPVPLSPGAPPVQTLHDLCGASTSREESGLPDEASAPSDVALDLEVIDVPAHTTEDIYDLYGSLTPSGTFIPRTVHTQIDYMHCLVPDQWNIMKSSFYWGKIDRYEADNLLENKPEGTFLLRDSAQEEFLFSVSFCRYGRTLHARIEQWNHKFSFDAHDPGVYSSDTICGLLEHYKDPNYCMFFEPMLTNPLPRANPPSLLELSRAQICTHVAYDSICYLKLPNSLKEFLREYHYKQRVRIRRVEVDMPQVPQAKQSIVTNTCISR